MLAIIVSLLGVALVVAGVALFSVPAAFVVAGVIAVGFGLFGLEFE